MTYDPASITIDLNSEPVQSLLRDNLAALLPDYRLLEHLNGTIPYYHPTAWRFYNEALRRGLIDGKPDFTGWTHVGATDQGWAGSMSIADRYNMGIWP